MNSKSVIPKWVFVILVRSGIILLAIIYKFRIFDNCFNIEKYTLINPDKIESIDARKQYNDIIDKSKLEFKLNTTAARLSLFMTTMNELDTENKVFSSTQFINGLMYCDWVINEDERIEASKNLEGKLLILNNAVSVINTNIDDINIFVYSLGNNRVSFEFIWKDLNSDIDELNELIVQYNKENNTKLIKISNLKDIYPNISTDEKKHIKELSNGN